MALFSRTVKSGLSTSSVKGTSSVSDTPSTGKKLNLGCGHDYRYDESWTNLDITPPCNVQADINDGLPMFEDEEFELIVASHILEHIHDLHALQLELARVLQRGGILEVIVPYYLSPDAWGDPTHCRAFSEESFLTCFWPGFNLLALEKREYKKRSMNTVDTWLHVKLLRNGMDLAEVQDRHAQHVKG